MNSAAVATPIAVGIWNQESILKDRLGLLFKTQFKGKCVITSHDDAKIIIIDSSKPDALDLTRLQKYVADNPHKHFILIGHPISVCPKFALLNYPPKIKELWEAIYVLGERATAEPVRHSNNVEKFPVTPPEETFSLDNYLLGTIKSAIDQASTSGQALQINCWEGKNLLLFPKSELVMSDLKQSQIRNLSLIQLSKSTGVSFKNLDHESIFSLSASPTSDIWTSRLETFLWNLALNTSKGRRPSSLTEDTVLTLKRWPNFTKINSTPNALRLAAFWSQNSADTYTTQDVLDIPISEVNEFVTAAYITGLLTRADTKDRRDCKPQHEKRSLFSAILDTFSFKKAI